MQRMCNRFGALLGALWVVSGWALTASAGSEEPDHKAPSHVCVGWYQGSPLHCAQSSETLFSVPDALERFIPDKYKKAELKRPPEDAFYFSLRFSAPPGQSSFWSDRFKLPILFESAVPNRQQALYFLGAFTQRGYARKQRLYMQKSLRKIQPDATLEMVQFRKDQGFVWVLSDPIPNHLIASQPLLKASTSTRQIAQAIPTQAATSVTLSPPSAPSSPVTMPPPPIAGTQPSEISSGAPSSLSSSAPITMPPPPSPPQLKTVALPADKTLRDSIQKTNPQAIEKPSSTGIKPEVAVKTAVANKTPKASKPRLQSASYRFNEIFAIRLVSYKTSVDWRAYLERLTDQYFTKAAFPKPSGHPPYCRKTPKNSIFVYAQIHENEETLKELLASRPDWKKQGAYVATLRNVSLKTCKDIMLSI